MCLSPLTIKVDVAGGATRTYTVPCGKCVECLKTRQNDYMVRIYEELMQAGKGCFLTLTYSPANVPYFDRDGKKYLTVWKPDVHSWLKRFRTNYERSTGNKGVRFFLCSEYGPRTHRPHYHCIFFGLDKSDLRLAIDDWRERFGYVLAKDISPDTASFERSARYVSKYSCKGILEDPFVQRNGLIKPWRSFSRGLGLTYVQRMKSFHCYLSAPISIRKRTITDSQILGGIKSFTLEYLDEVLKRKCVCINGFTYHMPRYYVNKIYDYEVEKHPVQNYIARKCRKLPFINGKYIRKAKRPRISQAKKVVKSALSVALADRASYLRFQRDCEKREADYALGVQNVALACSAEIVTLNARAEKVKQSLQAFYQRSSF